MRFSCIATAAALALLSSPSTSTDAFVPKHHAAAFQPRTIVSLNSAVVDVPTEPIQGMKPGTSGYVRPVDRVVWMT